MIQTDIIHEEQHENESHDEDPSQRHHRDSSDDGGNEDDFLDAQDQRILRDRILHAIEVFSKWTPNPRKEIMKQKKAFRLSIENRSRASSKKSKNSDRSFSVNDELNGRFGSSSPRKLSKKSQQYASSNQPQLKNKKEQMDIIDNFLKEFGMFNPNNAVSNSMGSIVGSNNLCLVGNKINNNKLPDLDEDVLSTISNEILRFQSNKKDQKNRKMSIDSNDVTPLKNAKTDTPIFKSPISAHQLTPSGNWQLCSQTNRMIIEQQIQSIMSLQLDNSARKVIIQKFLAQNPQAAQYLKFDSNQHLLQQPHLSNTALSAIGGFSVEDNTHRSQRAHSSITLHEDSKDLQAVVNTGREQFQQQVTAVPPYVTISSKVMNLTGGLQDHYKKEQMNFTQLSMFEQDHKNDSLRLRQPAKGKYPEENGSIISNISSSLFGFDEKLNSLNVKITQKQQQRKPHRKVKEAALVQFKDFQSTLATNQPGIRSKSSTNQYIDIKHQLANKSLNSTIIHSVVQIPTKKHLNNKNSLSQISKEQFVRYLPVPPMKQHDTKEIESPLKIEKLHQTSNTGDKRAIAYKTLIKKLNSSMVNAGTDTEVNELLKKYGSKSLLKGRKIILDRNGSHTLINVDAEGVKAIEKENNTERNKIVMPVYLTHHSQHNTILSPSKNKCSRQHDNQASRQSPTKRSLSGGKSLENDRVSSISVNVVHDRNVTQNSPRQLGTERSNLIPQREPSFEIKSILSSHQKSKQLKIDQIKEQFDHPQFKAELKGQNLDLLDISVPQSAQNINQRKGISRTSAMTPNDSSNHGSIFTKNKDAYHKWLEQVPKELVENNYNPLLQETERVHQIGIYQWSKMQRQINQNEKDKHKGLMIYNKAESQLNLDSVINRKSAVDFQRNDDQNTSSFQSRDHKLKKRISQREGSTIASTIQELYTITPSVKQFMKEASQVSFSYQNEQSLNKNSIPYQDNPLKREIFLEYKGKVIKQQSEPSQKTLRPQTALQQRKTFLRFSPIQPKPQTQKQFQTRKPTFTVSKTPQIQPQQIKHKQIVQQPQRYNEYPKNAILEYYIANKEQIVKDIIMKSGERQIQLKSNIRPISALGREHSSRIQLDLTFSKN